MHIFYRIAITTLIVIGSAYLFVLLNYAISFSILMDGCGQEISNETADNPVFKLFFEISSNTGYHPEPTRFNFYLSFAIGAAIGFFASGRIISRLKSLL